MTGCEKVGFSIGGIVFGLRSDEPGLVPPYLDGRERFLVEDEEPESLLTASWGLPDGSPHGREIFDTGSSWKLYRRDSGLTFHFYSPHSGPDPYRVARFGNDFSDGEVSLRRSCYRAGDPVDPLEYPLDEMLVVNLLSRGRGMEVHACGVVDERGEGHLFLGQSGAGKSTMAGLWQQRSGVKILSDDRIILRRGAEGFMIYGTPWHGEGRFSSPGSAPLKRIYFLLKGKRHRIQPLEPARAAAGLFACGIVPLYSAEGIDFTLSFVDRAVGEVPACDLSFFPDEGAVDTVLKWED